MKIEKIKELETAEKHRLSFIDKNLTVSDKLELISNGSITWRINSFFKESVKEKLPELLELALQLENDNYLKLVNDAKVEASLILHDLTLWPTPKSNKKTNMRKEIKFRILFMLFWIGNLLMAFLAYWFKLSFADIYGASLFSFLGLYNFAGFLILTNE